jgi:hypothetical protein
MISNRAVVLISGTTNGLAGAAILGNASGIGPLAAVGIGAVIVGLLTISPRDQSP